MEPVRRPQEEPSPEAVEFVRFCYRRRRIGWPEIYDEMCAVAGRGLFNGWTHTECAEHGIGFSLFEMPALAALVRRVIADDDSRRHAGLVPAARRAAPEPAPPAADQQADASAANGIANLSRAPAVA